MRNISELRDNAIKTIEDLKKGKIEVEEAGVTAKLYENIMSTLKTELAYHAMLEQKPVIPFLEGAKVIENTGHKLLDKKLKITNQ